MKTIPLVAMTQSGTKVPLGTADVEIVAGELVVMGTITNPDYQHLIRDKQPALSDYSVCTKDGFPIEAAYLPLPAIPAGRAQFIGKIPLPIIDPPEEDSNDD